MEKVVISGDFFAYPPEALEELEESLAGVEVEKVPEVIDSFRGRLTLLGASLDDLKDLLVELLSPPTGASS